MFSSDTDQDYTVNTGTRNEKCVGMKHCEIKVIKLCQVKKKLISLAGY